MYGILCLVRKILCMERKYQKDVAIISSFNNPNRKERKKTCGCDKLTKFN